MSDKEMNLAILNKLYEIAFAVWEKMAKVEGAELVNSNECLDYKDDPYGRLIPCGTINVQTWDISKVIS